MSREELRTLDKIVALKLDELEEQTEERDQCNRCRVVDCDILFAIIMILIIFGLLLLVVVYWMRGILAST